MLLFRRNGVGVDKLTNNKTFKEWFFCNVFREDDKVTTWLRKNVRERLRRSVQVLPAMVLARYVNRIETMKSLLNEGLFDLWNPIAAADIMRMHSPITNAAYVIKTPDRMDKARGIAAMVSLIEKDHVHLMTRLEPGTTLQSVTEALCMYHLIGPFMAYEIVSDLRHTDFLCNAPDIMTWGNPGPGATRGMSWLVNLGLETINRNNKMDMRDMVESMQVLIDLSTHPDYWPHAWPPWEMREVEHWLCEYAKYVKAQHMGLRLKRRYKG